MLRTIVTVTPWLQYALVGNDVVPGLKRLGVGGMLRIAAKAAASFLEVWPRL